MKRCRRPDKEKLSKADAKGKAARLRATEHANITAYKCAGHWHVGHTPRGQKRKRWR